MLSMLGTPEHYRSFSTTYPHTPTPTPTRWGRGSKGRGVTPPPFVAALLITPTHARCPYPAIASLSQELKGAACPFAARPLKGEINYYNIKTI